jgi:hypothetical protein
MNLIEETVVARAYAEAQVKSLLEMNEALGLRAPTLALTAGLAAILLVIKNSPPDGVEKNLEGLFTAMKALAELEYGRHLDDLARKIREAVDNMPPTQGTPIN